MIGKYWPRPLAAVAVACSLTVFVGWPALAQDPPVVSAGAAPGSLSVSWQARDGAIDYDLRYHAGSADPSDEADWVEEGEANGPPDPGAFTSETITGLEANTTYRVQVRAETAGGEGPWSASGSATTASLPAPKIKHVHIVSWPSHNANGRGRYDTYIRGEAILVDVTFNEPVQVGGDGNVVMRLDLGEDDGDPANSRRTATLQSVRYGDTVLRFGYTVAAGDTDPDGVWVQTGADDTVLFTPGSATVTGADSGVAVDRTAGPLKTTGDPKSRVDGGRTSVPGPRPAGAAVNGDTLTVTFDEPLDTSVDPGAMRYLLSVLGAGGVDVAQHPRAVSLSGATLTLTLSHAARPGQEPVTLYYDGGRLLRDLDGNQVPPFRELAVANATPGGPAPSPLRASAVGRELRLVFNRALDESSPPPGDAFVIKGYSQGTGTATVSGKTVTVRLVEAVPAADRLRVNYTKPGETPPTYRTYPEPGGDPLRGAAADNPEVPSFYFWIETVHDGVPPALLGAEVSQTQGSPPRTRAVLSFDEALDAGSVPAAGDFAVRVAGAAATVSAVAVEDTSVVLTLDAAAAAGSQVAVSYVPGTNPIRDQAGNAVTAFERTVAAAGSGRPVLQSATVNESRLTLTFDLPLDPGSVPALGAFTLHRPLDHGERAADRGLSGYRLAAVAVAGRTAVLSLENAVTACAGGLIPFTVTYAKPAASPLQGLDGTDADGFEHRAATNDLAPECEHPPTGVRWPTSLTASFGEVPAAHDGRSLFSFELLFSENFPGRLDYLVLRDRAFQVENGRVRGAKRAVQGQNRRWTITVRPASRGDVTITLPAGAVATAAGRPLATAVSTTVAGPPPSVSVADAAADEGGTLTFAVTLSHAAAGPVTVDWATADGTATAGADYTAASGTLTFAAGETAATVEVAALADTTAEADETISLALSNPVGATLGDGEAEGTITAVPPPLTASFAGLPAGHDGRRLFSFELVFSENFPGQLDYKVLRDRAFQVGNGRVREARRAAQRQNRRWTIAVRPSSHRDVTVTLPAGSVTTQAGRSVANTVTATVQGPALLSVANARAREGADSAVAFPVTLSRAASGEVTVEYVTRNGTAKAGEDYERTRGTLVFAAGETGKTVSVPILDDVHDEGVETFTLKLRNATGAWIVDGEATGTIVNADPIPKAWLARFGRTVTGQVLNAVEARLAAPRQTGTRAALAGQALPSWTPGGAADDPPTGYGTGNASPERTSPADAADALRRWTHFAGAESRNGTASFDGFGEDPGSRPDDELRGLAQRDLLTGTSFALTAQSDGLGGGFASVWGRGAISAFDGRESHLTLDGEARAGLIGTDWSSAHEGPGRWTAGLAIGRSAGTGGYRTGGCADGNCDGKIEATLTGLYPYGGATLTDRLLVWLTAGHGAGELTVRPDGVAPFTTDLSMSMGAAGLRSEVLKPADASGLSLALKGDGRFTRTESETAASADGGRLAEAEADVWMLRTGIEGSRRFAFPGSGSGAGGEGKDGAGVTPSFEVGLRLDGGDAETGFGADMGGGLAFADPENGLRFDMKARGLVAHRVSGFREWGASASFAWDPRPATDRGPSLSLTRSLGASPSGGMDALLSRETLIGLAANENGSGDGGGFRASGRTEGETGYGLAMVGGRFTGTPNLGVGLWDGGAREYRLGWRLTSMTRGDPGFEITLDATRKEPANDSGSGTPAEHGVTLRAAMRW